MAKSKSAFTLVEILVVIAIVAILIAWTLPALRQARDQARLTGCLSNEKQIGTVIAIYAGDNEGYFPVPPIGQYFTTDGLDAPWVWMHAFIFGDDIGVWSPVAVLPAQERPLAPYIDPYSHVYRCPADDSSPWTYGLPRWDILTASYGYNATPRVGHPGLYDVRADEVSWPSITIAIGDAGWNSTRPNLASNDLWSFTNLPHTWWHPLGFQNRKTVIGFTDGRAAYTQVQILVGNTDTYRRDP